MFSNGVVAISLVMLLTVCWMRPVEYYPLTAWQMYCGKNTSSDVCYYRVWTHYADGTVEPARFEQWIGAMSDARYRRVIAEACQGKELALNQFLAACLDRANAGEDRSIRAFEIEQWHCRTSESDQNGNPGTLRRVIRYSNDDLVEVASGTKL